MNEIRSKRSRQFYRKVITNILFGLLFSDFLFRFTIKDFTFKISNWELPIIILGWVYGLYQSIKGIYLLIKHTPLFAIDENKIRIKGKDLYFSNNPEIKLFSTLPNKYINIPFSSFVANQNEGCIIQFEGEKPIYILDNLYSNAPEMKRFIDTHILKQDYFKNINGSIITNTGINNNNPKTFKGGLSVSFTAVFCLLAAFFLIMMFVNIGIEPFLFCFFGVVLYCIFLCFISIRDLYYITITDTQIIVKNHLPFVKTITINLHEIGEIAFENYFLYSRCVRIITTDYNNKLIPLNTFKIETFRRFLVAILAYNPAIMIRRKDSIKLGNRKELVEAV